MLEQLCKSVDLKLQEIQAYVLERENRIWRNLEATCFLTGKGVDNEVVYRADFMKKKCITS